MDALGYLKRLFIIKFISSYEFEGLKTFYVAWLRDIKLGIKNGLMERNENSYFFTKHLLKNKF